MPIQSIYCLSSKWPLWLLCVFAQLPATTNLHQRSPCSLHRPFCPNVFGLTKKRLTWLVRGSAVENMEQHGTSKTREVTFERCQMAMRDAFIEGWREHPAAATRTLTSLAKAGSLELQLFDQIKGKTHRNTCLPLCRHCWRIQATRQASHTRICLELLEDSAGCMILRCAC